MKKVEVIIRPEKLDDMKEIWTNAAQPELWSATSWATATKRDINPSITTAIIL